MPTTLVRYAALLVFLLGATLLILRQSGTGSGRGYDTVRLVHILVALGLLGLYEVAMARSRRQGQLSAIGQRYGLVGRIVLTLTLLVGIFLLFSLLFSWLSGTAFDVTVYLHVLLGLIAVSLAALIFWRQPVSK